MPRFMLVVAALSLLVSAAEAKPKKSAEKAPAKTAERLSRAEACRERFRALCGVMQGCVAAPEDLGGRECQAIDSGCDALKGEASHARAQLDACVSGLKAQKCERPLDPMDALALDFEARVPACKALASGEAPADKGGKAAGVTASH